MNFQMNLLFGILLYISNVHADLRFASYYGDGMVLQKSPDKASVWGYADTSDADVTVLLDDEEVATTTVDSNKQWQVKLPATESGGPHTIEVRSGGSSASLTGVMFGEVWICSGQSNMEFGFSNVQNYQQDLAKVVTMDNIRLMKVRRKTSTTAVEEPDIDTNWQLPANDAGTQYFSGLCILFAMELSAHVHDRPIGMIASSWGGTPVEAWSDQSALDRCPATNFDYGSEPEHQNKQLWNGMIAPLTKMTIKGAIWYQGESNGEHAAEYKCSFKAMIDDWREQFHADSGTADDFPFGFVQLAAWRDEKLPSGFIDIRWSQTYEYGYVPNPSMPKVFMAVAHDLPDFDSPFGGGFRGKYKAKRPLVLPVAIGEERTSRQGNGTRKFVRGKQWGQLSLHFNLQVHHSDFEVKKEHFVLSTYIYRSRKQDVQMCQCNFRSIHPRDKEDIAVRLALAARGVAYNQPVDFQGPFPSSFSLLGNELAIEYDDGNGNLDVRNNDGFELCCKSSCTAYDFTETTILSSTASTVTIDTSVCQGQTVTAVRYAWEETPCQFKQCPIYGKDTDLPAPCFKKEGPF